MTDEDHLQERHQSSPYLQAPMLQGRHQPDSGHFPALSGSLIGFLGVIVGLLLSPAPSGCLRNCPTNAPWTQQWRREPVQPSLNAQQKPWHRLLQTSEMKYTRRWGPQQVGNSMYTRNPWPTSWSAGISSLRLMITLAAWSQEKQKHKAWETIMEDSMPWDINWWSDCLNAP